MITERFKSIQIKPKGVNIEVERVEILELADGTTREQIVGDVFCVGLGDVAQDAKNPTEQELAAHYARVDEICGARLGKTLADAIADATASNDQIAAARAEAVKAREDSKKRQV